MWYNGDNIWFWQFSKLLKIGGGAHYYWTTAIASNNSSGLGRTRYVSAPDSICPKGWRLPQGAGGASYSADTYEFTNLLKQTGVITDTPNQNINATYSSDGLNKIRSAPLYFARSGVVYSSALNSPTSYVSYWSSSAHSTAYAFHLYFNDIDIGPAAFNNRYDGRNVRCVAR